MPSRPTLTALAVLLPTLTLACANEKSESAGGRMAPASVEMTAAQTVSGYVYLASGLTAPKRPELTVSLVDATVSGKEQILATVNPPTRAAPPYAFSLKAPPLNPGHIYEVRAVLKSGKQVWTHTQSHAVLTGNHPAYVEIQVGPAIKR